MPVQPITNVTEEIFLSEIEIFNIVKAYFAETTFTAEQLQDWMGKDCSWGTTKKRRVGSERRRGRTINLVKEDLRGITY